MQPINYGVEIQDPTQSFLSAFQTGAAIQDTRLKQEQQQQQMANQKLIQEGFAKLRQPGATAADYANLAMVLPETQAKSVRESFSMLSGERQQNALQQSGQVFSAFKAGKPEIAIGLLERQIEAKRNSGDNEGAMFLETWRDVAKENPKATEDYFGFTISQMPGGDKVIESAVKLGGERRAEALAPGQVSEQTAKASEAQSNAQKAAVAAKFAESNAVKDLERKGWDITKIQSDMAIAKQNAQIAAMNAATSRESNAIKRQENQLKLQELIDKRDTAVREKAGEVESARADMDNFLNTADRILATPKSVIGSAAGPISARMPTLSQDTADFEALVETLGSQSFMSQIPKMRGAGALSEREGDKLQASLQNLSLKQSPERLIENVKESQRLILKARSTLSKKSGLPDTIPDTPAVQTNATDIDALLKKYGGTK
jgi:hypothetical protein